MTAIHGTRNQPDLTSFTYAVDRETGCWDWLGYCDPNGYARIYNRVRKVIEWAHRFSYEEHVAPIPAGYEIDHICQNTRCVNPEHLQTLTRREHCRVTMSRLGKDDLHRAAAVMRARGAKYSEIADALGYAGRTSAHRLVQTAINKGLIDPEEVPPTPRLTPEDRKHIRELVQVGIPQQVVGQLFGIHNSQVSRVAAGKNSRGKEVPA